MAWYLFMALTFVSAIIWHYCKEEAEDGLTLYKPFWFLQSDNLTDKGNRYRKWFIGITGLALLNLFFWANL